MSKDLPAWLDDLVTRQAELTERLRSLREERDRLVPQLDVAKTEAAKPPEAPTGTSAETLLESATQSALARYTWKAKAEGLQVALDWIHKRLAEEEQQHRRLEEQIAEARRRLERETEAQKGIEAMNAAIETVKQQLTALKARDCHHIYAVNLPEFCLDEHGQVSVRPHSFKIP